MGDAADDAEAAEHEDRELTVLVPTQVLEEGPVGGAGGVTNALTGVLEAQADALRARLLGVPQLTREQQIELDAELSTATYIS